MSVKLMSRVWTRAFNNHAQQAVMLAFANRADDDGAKAFPGLKLVAWETGYSERQVKRATAELEKLGALIPVTPATRTRPTEYRIHLDVIPPKPPLSGAIVSPHRQNYQGTPCPNGVTPCPDQVTFATGSGDICDSAIRKEPSRTVKEPKTFALMPPGDAEFEPVDPRHAFTRALIQEFHLTKFKLRCEWNGREGKALSELLSANVSWTREQIEIMVRNRFTSDGATSARPAKWIPSLGDFYAGPLDRFGKLKGGGGNGNRNRAEQVQASIIDAVAEAKAANRSSRLAG